MSGRREQFNSYDVNLDLAEEVDIHPVYQNGNHPLNGNGVEVPVTEVQLAPVVFQLSDSGVFNLHEDNS